MVRQQTELGSRHQLSGCHLTLLEGQQRVFVQAGSIWVGESVDELAFEHFCTYLGGTDGGKFGNCLFEFAFKAKRVRFDSLSDILLCGLKLDC